MRVPGVRAVARVADRRRVRRVEAAGDATARSKVRWRDAPTNEGLTWGMELSGEPLIELAGRHELFGPDRTVVEVGPGYGRFLRAALEAGAEFRRYVGLDISAQHVAVLSSRFEDPRVEFRNADVEEADLGEPVDAIVSFLTFKHLHPSFERAVANLGAQLSPDGRLVFDLIEGSRRYFQADGSTYVREYGRDEARELVERAGLELVGFDSVVHAPGWERLVVVARPRPR
jgi:SAM-dependent methyltransferase